MKEDELNRIKAKKDPLRTEMRRVVQAMVEQGREESEILKELSHWDQGIVKEIIERQKESKPKPDRYYTSIREPLLSDRFDK